MASPRGKNDAAGSRETTRTLPERVGQLYYTHGLFCSSHPIPVISFAIAVVLLCCYPLLNLPLPGNVPQQYYGNFSVVHKNISSPDVGDTQLPRWFSGSPIFYIQQVVIKTSVLPWTEDLVMTDAFRAPLAEVFKLLEVIRNYQHENSSRSLSHVCLHIESAKVKSDKKMALPEYNCLLLSPANLWQQNQEKFQEDSNLLGTIFSYQNLQKGKISLAEILFGMHMKDTGIKRYPLRTRQRVLQYAITLVLKEYDLRFVEGLRNKLVDLYPLHQPHNSAPASQWMGNTETILNASSVSQNSGQEILHIYFPGQFTLSEFVPLTATYFILFLYMYFSVRKIELVKSKFGMAFSAVVTVLASLSMSIGLCFFFGLTLTITGKEIFPYLVVIIGLENILVLTKSVVSTPTHLDVKIRVAQGLSREGWSITKNLLIEVTILTVGLFTFVPAIQEFCIFAVVGLLSDFFLQVFFFSTVLAIDIRRMELSSETQHHRFPYGPSSVPQTSHRPLPLRPPIASPLGSHSASKSQVGSIVKSKSHPRLNGLTSSSYPTNVVASPNSPPATTKVPKRLKLVHFWARTRIFQRAFMVCMVVWIAVIMYSSGVLEQVLQMTANDESLPTISERDSEFIGSGLGESPEVVRQYYDVPAEARSSLEKAGVLDNVDLKLLQSIVTEDTKTVTPTASSSEMKRIKGTTDKTETGESSDVIGRLKHMGYEPWRRLSHYHWPAILSLYNISLAGHYISILPPIRLSHIVSPDKAKILRNPNEKTAQHFQWQALAAALDPLDFSDGGESGKSSVVGMKTVGGSSGSGEVPYVPSSPMELFLTAVLCVISIVVVAYTMVMLYRCVCSRNYAEWRASWAGDGEGATQDGITQVVMEAVPLVLDGHPQEVECVATDGTMIVSSCLGGQLRVWDSNLGEALATIDRKLYFSSLQKSSVVTGEVDTEELSDYESGSPPSRGERDIISTSPTLSHRKRLDGSRILWNMPDLRPSINTNFSGIKSVNSDKYSCNKSGYDFKSKFQNLYEEHQKSLESDVDDSNDDKNWNVLSFKSKSTATKIPPPVSSFTFERTSSPTKRTLEDPFSETSNVRGGIDISDRTQIQKLPVGSSNFFRENTNKGALSSKTDSETSAAHLRQTRQALKSVPARRVSDPLTDIANSDNSTKAQSEVEECCEIVCGVDKVESRERGSSLPGSPTFSWIRDIEKKLPNCGQRGSHGDRGLILGSQMQQPPPIWCLDCHENLIAIGCANGRLEFWEGSTGTFKCLFEDGTGSGITSVKIIGNRVVAAKLNGSVDFLELESYSHGRQMDWGFTAYRRTHVRSGSTGSITDWDTIVNRNGNEEDLRCIRLNTTKAHQQPITVLDSEGGRVLTGSKDHTLKVFRLEDQLPLYTLHGHCGPVTCLFIDRISPMTSGSGSQDGLLCVWDLLTGACMYSLQAHDGSVTALTYSASYVISLGTDERLCVWERFQGHLLNTIQVSHTYCCSMVMFTHNLLITSKQGSLVVWDVRTGDPVRIVKLGHSDGSVFVKQILLLRDSIACDYSNQLRIVRFPLVVTNKCD